MFSTASFGIRMHIYGQVKEIFKSGVSKLCKIKVGRRGGTTYLSEEHTLVVFTHSHTVRSDIRMTSTASQ